jgi:hypothetical protein
MIARLPEDLSALDQEELTRARNTRDARLTVLFRRWPALNKVETKEIRQLHDERTRLAKYFGRLRRRRLRRPPSKET